MAAISDKISNAVRFVKKQEKSFKVNMLRASSTYFLRSLVLQYQPIYIVALGATAFQLGMVNSIGGLSAAIVALPIGWLADKHGLKRILLLATSSMVFGALLFASARDWVTTVPALLIFYLGVHAEMTVCPVVCGSSLKGEERATGMGLCDTLVASPELVSPIIGAVIITSLGGLNEHGIRPLYYLQVLGFFTIVVLIWKHFGEPEKRVNLIVNSTLAEGMDELFAQTNIMKRWILFVCLSTTPLYMGKMVYVPLFAAQVKGVDQFILGGMAMASATVPLLLAIPFGRLADTMGRKKTFSLAISIYCMSLLLLIYSTTTTILLLSGVLQGFFMIATVVRGAMTTELVPVSVLGRMFGVLGLFRGLVMVVAPIVGGIIWSAVGPEYVLFFIILTQVLGALVLLTVPETLKRKTRFTNVN